MTGSSIFGTNTKLYINMQYYISVSDLACDNWSAAFSWPSSNPYEQSGSFMAASSELCVPVMPYARCWIKTCGVNFRVYKPSVAHN